MERRSPGLSDAGADGARQISGRLPQGAILNATAIGRATSSSHCSVSCINWYLQLV